MYFDILGQIGKIELIARGRGIRELAKLRKKHGTGQWRKLKGVAHVRLPDGIVRLAELHWYEAHGVGKVRFKIKRFLDTDE